MDVNKHLFTGFQLNYQNIVARSFMVGHTLHLGKEEQMMMSLGADDEEADKASYTIHSTYTRKNLLMQGMIGTNGISQTILSYSRGGFGMFLHGQVLDKNLGYDINFCYSLHESCIEAKLQSRGVGLAYTQALTPQLSFGAEYSIGLPNKISNKILFQHKDKETHTKKTISLSYGTEKSEAKVYYSKKFTKNLEFLSAYKLTQKKKDGSTNFNSNWYFGYSTKSNRAVIKALIDGNGSVFSLTEIPFSNMATMVLSGKINYKLNSYDFGFGVNMMM